MGFRDYIKKISDEGKLKKIKEETSKKLETSGILKSLEPVPILFEKII